MCQNELRQMETKNNGEHHLKEIEKEKEREREREREMKKEKRR